MTTPTLSPIFRAARLRDRAAMQRVLASIAWREQRYADAKWHKRAAESFETQADCVRWNAEAEAQS